MMELLETSDSNAETPLLYRKSSVVSRTENGKSSDNVRNEAAVSLSKSRQYVLLLSLVTVNFCMQMIDSSLYPFFPEAAKRKGLMEANIGIIFASYDICRFLGSPLSGILVSRIPLIQTDTFRNLIGYHNTPPMKLLKSVTTLRIRTNSITHWFQIGMLQNP